MNLHNLSQIHTSGHAQRIQENIYGFAIWQIGHILLGNNLRDDALIPVAAGHLITYGQFSLLSHIDFDKLNHAGCEFIAANDLFRLTSELPLER